MLAPVIVTGNAAVVVSSYARPLPAVTLTEVIATSDVPDGVVNLLTGDPRPLARCLAGHMGVNAIDLGGAADDPALVAELEAAAAENLKRVRRAPAQEPDFHVAPGLDAMTRFLEIKSVWHPTGM